MRWVGVFFPAWIVFTVSAFAADKCLVIGDSVSIGYTRWLAKNFEKTEVVHILVNAGNTVIGLNNIDKWLSELPDADLIVWNFGLHDLADAGTAVELSTYGENISALATRLKETGARIVFVSTTTVDLPNARDRRPEDVVAYNSMALKIMSDEGISVCDLYSVSLRLPRLDGVHYSPDGYELLARALIPAIEGRPSVTWDWATDRFAVNFWLGTDIKIFAGAAIDEMVEVEPASIIGDVAWVSWDYTPFFLVARGE